VPTDPEAEEVPNSFVPSAEDATHVQTTSGALVCPQVRPEFVDVEMEREP
jgi:hypothetical protein